MPCEYYADFILITVADTQYIIQNILKDSRQIKGLNVLLFIQISRDIAAYVRVKPSNKMAITCETINCWKKHCDTGGKHLIVKFYSIFFHRSSQLMKNLCKIENWVNPLKILGECF